MLWKWDIVSLLIGICAGSGVLAFHDWRIPRFLRSPRHVVEFYNTQGSEVTCTAEGKPSPAIGWIKRGGSVVNEKTGLRYVRSDGTLVFSPFRPDEYRQDLHSAIYRCTATNAIGTVGSHEVHVRAIVTQQFDVRVYDEFVTQGNIAVMKCHIPSFVKDFVSVTSWYRDDGLIVHSDEAEGGKHYVLPSGELHINNVQQQDGFHGYQCQVKLRLSGEAKQSLSSGQLIVTERHSNIAPRLVHRVNEVRGQEGDQVIIPCVAQGNPPPTYSWSRIRNGQLVPVAVGLRVHAVDGTLRIRHALADDTGKYHCTCNNSVGQDSVETSLVISVPLKVTVTPSVRKVQLGQSVTFNCTVSGSPIDGVNWVKNLVPVTSSERIRFPMSTVLAIKGIQREDKGVYQCLAQGGATFDSAQGSAALLLGDEPPVLQSVFSENTLHTGTSISLKCSASGSPLPQVTWKLDGLSLPEILRFRVGDYVTMDSRVVSYVNITNVRPEDGGIYSCSASNDVGAVTHISRINVFGPPVVRHMPNVTTLAGTVLRVQCPVGGYPVTAIAWERNGRQLPQNHRQSVEENGTLVLREINRKSDEGKYTCIVQNSQGDRGSGDLHLHVLVAPKIEPFQFPSDLEEGMRSVAVCAVLAGDPPLEITWLKDGRVLTSDLNARVDPVNDFTSTLTFASVGPQQSGSYTCVARNPAAVVNHTTEMIVRVSPFWVKQPTDGSAVVGGSLSVDCQADGNPTPQIRWKTSTGSPGSFRTVISNPQIQILENGSLVFREVEQSDQGDYMCQAVNGVSPGLSVIIKISVHVPAHFKNKFQSMTREKGEKLMLECPAYGEKPLTLTWTRDKQNLDLRAENRYAEEHTLNENGTLSKLVIHSVERRDSSLFTCHINNVFGSDERNIQVIILEKPDGPRNVHAKDVTTRTVVMSWSPSFSGNSPITKYTMQYKLTTEEWPVEDKNMLTISPPETSVAINRLLPSTSYHFRVFAENALGRSESSAVVVVTTLEEAPSSPPFDIVAKPISSRALKISWKAPAEKSQITGYYLGFREHNSKEQFSYKTLKAAKGLTEEYKLQQLKRNTKYSLRLQAFNKAGAGPASDEVLAHTLQYDPPLPAVLQVTSIQANSARIHWKRGDDAPITGYLLQYKDEKSKEWTEVSLGTEHTSYELQSLRCGTRYQIRMVLFNAVGRSEASETHFKTEGTAPVAPEKSNFLAPNVTFVVLQLTAWQTGDCPVETFAVQYRASEDKDWLSLESVVPAGQGTLLIAELLPASWYNVFVTAINPAGSTGAEFVFSTLTVSGDSISPIRVQNRQERRFSKHLSIVVPIICAVVIVIVVIIVVCAIHTRRHPHPGRAISTPDNGEFQGRQMHKGDSLVMTSVRKKDPLATTYESPKDSLYYPAPYATSRLPGYVIDGNGSECESFHSSQRGSGSQGSHTYDVPFPVKKPEPDEQYTRIKRISAPSVPCTNLYQTPQLRDVSKWRTYQQRPLSEKCCFKTECGAKQRRWSAGGFKTGTNYRKERFKRIDGMTYRLSDDESDEGMNGDDFEENHEVSEAECDREVKFLTGAKGNYLTVVIPPEGGNFCKTTTTVH